MEWCGTKHTASPPSASGDSPPGVENTVFRLQRTDSVGEKPRNTEAHGVFTEKPHTEAQPLWFRGSWTWGFSSEFLNPSVRFAWGLAESPHPRPGGPAGVLMSPGTWPADKPDTPAPSTQRARLPLPWV